MSSLTRLMHQLNRLERRTIRGGRDRIDHPTQGSDDVANAVVLALVAVATDAQPTLIRRGALVPKGGPVDAPERSTGNCAIVFAGDDGTAAATYWATISWLEPRQYLLGFSVERLTEDVLLKVAARLREYEEVCRPVGVGSAIWTTPELRAMCYLPGTDVDPLPKQMLENPQKVAMRAAMHAHAGRAVMTNAAQEQGQRYPLAGALSFNPSDSLDAKHPLRQALLYGIAWGFEERW